MRIPCSYLLAAMLLSLAGLSSCSPSATGDYHVVQESEDARATRVQDSTDSQPATSASQSLPDAVAAPEASAPLNIHTDAAKPTLHLAAAEATESNPEPATSDDNLSTDDDAASAKPESETTADEGDDDRAAVLAAIAERDLQITEMRAQMLGGDPLNGGKPRPIRLLVPERKFQEDAASGALRVTFDDLDLLKVLNMDPVPTDVMEHLPDWLRELDGKRVILRGWMYPAGRVEGISRFMFVRDNGICCFQREPKVYDKLRVTMRDGQTTQYINGHPFDVVAKLSINADVIDGEVFWLYSLDDAVVVEN